MKALDSAGEAHFKAVGHRGWPEHYPENSKIGLLAAAQAGATCVELDVQISRDGVPVVFHDDKLRRVCDHKGYVWDYTAMELRAISCHEPKRFGDKYFPEPIATLQEVAEALADFNLTIFVEIKEESFAYADRKEFFACIHKALSAVADKVVIISFDADILFIAKSIYPIGWVLRKMDKASQLLAHELGPQFLIYNVKKLAPSAVIWPGDWEWFLYDIVDPEIARFWFGKGVNYIETWDVRALL